MLNFPKLIGNIYCCVLLSMKECSLFCSKKFKKLATLATPNNGIDIAVCYVCNTCKSGASWAEVEGRAAGAADAAGGEPVRLDTARYPELGCSGCQPHHYLGNAPIPRDTTLYTSLPPSVTIRSKY